MKLNNNLRSQQGATPGPWSLPHFADPNSDCNCGLVLSDNYAGAVATVYVNNGRLIDDGGNNSPPLHEAEANARLIAAAPELLAACMEVANGYSTRGSEMARAAIAAATGEQPK